VLGKNHRSLAATFCDLEASGLMRILFVQDHLQTGGAAKCALRMQRICRELGHETLALHGDEASLPGILSRCLHGKPRGFLRLWETFQVRDKQQSRRRERAEKKLLHLLKDESFDFVWFHNFSGARKWGWTERWIEMALQRSKVVITLHDMEYLGVGMPYVWDRPLHPSRFAGLDPGTAKEWNRNGRLRINACSRWLGQMCHKLYELPCGQLPVPLWEEDFHKTARRPGAGPTIRYLLAAELLDDPRKNILPTIHLLQENQILERTNSVLLCLGRNFPERLRGPRVIPLGHVENRARYRQIYEKVDYLLHPSLLDNFPLLIQESLAQGCPVVALDRGGVREMVIEGRSGHLLADVSPGSLGNIFLNISRKSEAQYEELSRSCLALATDLFLADGLAPRYEAFLGEVLHA
jgi:glycosyltransferase involved in cell wall biosynthesis